MNSSIEHVNTNEKLNLNGYAKLYGEFFFGCYKLKILLFIIEN